VADPQVLLSIKNSPAAERLSKKRIAMRNKAMDLADLILQLEEAQR